MRRFIPAFLSFSVFSIANAAAGMGLAHVLAWIVERAIAS